MLRIPVCTCGHSVDLRTRIGTNDILIAADSFACHVLIRCMPVQDTCSPVGPGSHMRRIPSHTHNCTIRNRLPQEASSSGPAVTEGNDGILEGMGEGRVVPAVDEGADGVV